MTTETVTLFFALLAWLCLGLVLVALIAAVGGRHTARGRAYLVDVVGPVSVGLGAVIALVATAGSLYLSEVANFPPCRLCWYQRIGMYPLAVVLTVAAMRRDLRIWPYGLALAGLALPISVYHVLLERWPSLETGACEVANPCSVVWVRHFGVVTIPFMAGSGFAAVIVCMLLAAARLRRGEEDRRVDS
jgi:disulfide bond formation protein DsbB